MSQIFCPSCGTKHNTEPARYEWDDQDERASFEEGGTELAGFEEVDGVVILKSARLEAGPFNGERNLVDYDVDMYRCPNCGNEFTSDLTAV